MRKFLLLLFLIFNTSLPAQDYKSIDSLYNYLSGTKPYNNLTLGTALTKFHWGNKNALLKKYQRLIYLAAANNNKFLHSYFMYCIAWLYDFPTQQKMLSDAYSIASDEKYYDLMGLIQMARGIDFKQNQMFDSAMSYCLDAKNILEKVGDTYSLVDVMLTIADMHYDSGQLEKAEQMYKRIQIIKGEPIGWNSWRKVVVLNDLGLIKIKQEKYSKALNYFKESLRFKFSSTHNHFSYSDSAQVEYIYRKLCDIYLLENNLSEAKKYFLLSFAFAKQIYLQSEFIPLYINMGKLYNLKGQYDSALAAYKKAESYDITSPEVENKLSLYSGLSKIYERLNDYKNEAKYLQLAKAARIAYDSTYYRSRYMTLYAEYKYNNYQSQIASDKKTQMMLTIIIVIILLSLLTITYYFIRLKRSKQMLVQKSIELASAEPLPIKAISQCNIIQENNKKHEIKSESDEIDELSAGSSSRVKNAAELDSTLLNEIIVKLGHKVLEDKVYLNPNLTISMLAEQLGTNRTYLSKAIIQEYKMNFISYINELRIKEAIRFITNREHYNLNMDGIAQKAGFNNRVSFTNTFQKYTGVSPSFFIKNAGAGIGISKK